MKWNKLTPIIAVLFVLMIIISFQPQQAAADIMAAAGRQQAQPQSTPQPDTAAMPPFWGGNPLEGSLVTADDAANKRLNAAEPNQLGPTINVWYGNEQNFGQLGNAQKWVNILGNVSNPFTVTALSYTFNGGPAVPLNMGPDGLRLAEEGDFNIEIDYNDLNVGNNVVVISATDASGTAQVTVNVNYQSPPASWPAQVVVDWTDSNNIQDLAQVIDGQWEVDTSANTVRPLTYDFDRLLGIGDMSWADYEVTVPVVIKGIDEGGFLGASNGPGIGFITRWSGHFDLGSEQPRTGWQNLGALGWYRWAPTDPVTTGFQLIGYGGDWLATNDDKQLAFETPYFFKMKVASNPGQTATYSFKVWEQGTAEPVEWDLQAQGTSGEPKSGSILLIAHHVEVVFGEVIVDLNTVKTKPQLTLNTIGEGSVQATPAANNGVYNFAEDVELTAVPAENYEFAGWSGDLGGIENPATITMFNDKQVTAVFVDPSQLLPESDKFNRCELGQNWTFVDPVGNSFYTMTGYQAAISVPAGSSHDIWIGGNNSARLMQPAQDDDFEIETKIDSNVDTFAQLQGFIVEQNTQNFLRFDVFHDQNNTRLFAASFNNNVPFEQGSMVINDITESIYLRVTREGNTWTQSYSYDGTTWLLGNSFDYTLPVTAVGLFAGNAAANPAHTAAFDYFLNNAAPIDVIDDPIAITTEIIGQGTVAVSPDLPAYTCGQTVTLTAAPASGWLFESWEGAATGTNLVTTVDLNIGETEVVANFRPELSQDYTLDVNIISNGNGMGGTVTKNPDQAFYDWRDEVTLTANPASGWTFDGWGGGLITDENPATLTMMQNEVVSATFSQGLYSIDVSVSAGNGGYTLVPDKELYEYGEIVTLTAHPDAGWAFAGWDGDVPNGTNGINPLTFEVTQDHEISLLFTEAYKLTLPIIIRQ